MVVVEIGGLLVVFAVVVVFIVLVCDVVSSVVVDIGGLLVCVVVIVGFVVVDLLVVENGGLLVCVVVSSTKIDFKTIAKKILQDVQKNNNCAKNITGIVKQAVHIVF